MPAPTRRFLKPLAGEALDPPPLWLMRQAGRYLPEYRKVREEAGSFLALCYDPRRAAEVTLQPIRRYGFDAAILFSDILVIPHALGQRLEFVEGEGPRLEPVSTVADLTRLSASGVSSALAPVIETVHRVRSDLSADTALIGFCGAPWTVATYMVAGRGTKDQADARLWAYRDREGFGKLIELIVAVSADYLSAQVKAGADVLQIFDTWAGGLPESEFERWVIQPTRKLVDAVKSRHPTVPIIGFPRGAGSLLHRYARETRVEGLGCDTGVPVSAMRALGQEARVAVQGNLDPLLLVAGGSELEAQVRSIRAGLKGVPFIFNLGHGIVPETPPAHVERLVRLVRESAKS